MSSRPSVDDLHGISAAEEQPLMTGIGNSEDTGGMTTSRSERHPGISKSITIHTIILLLNCLLFIFGTWSVLRNPCAICSKAIQDVNIRLEQVVFHNLSNSAFAGPAPDPGIDDKWKKMLSPMNMRVTEEELRRTGQQSVPLPEKGGYLAWLGVFHELHCIVS